MSREIHGKQEPGEEIRLAGTTIAFAGADQRTARPLDPSGTYVVRGLESIVAWHSRSRARSLSRKRLMRRVESHCGTERKLPSAAKPPSVMRRWGRGCHWRRSPALFLASGLAWALPAAAQDLPAWYTRAEIGAAGIHNSDVNQPWVGVRVGRAFGQARAFALDAGVARAEESEEEAGFTTVTGGLELRIAARSRVSPYVRLELGYLHDEGAIVGGAGGGMSVRVSGRLALRAGAMWSNHYSPEQWDGPVCYFGGLEYRW